MIYAVLSVVIPLLVILRFRLKPTFKVVAYRTRKGYLSIRIYRKALTKFPNEAEKYDTGTFHIDDKYVVLNVVYPSKDEAEDEMVKAIAKAKNLCERWNRGEDPSTHLEKSAKRLIKGK